MKTLSKNIRKEAFDNAFSHLRKPMWQDEFIRQLEHWKVLKIEKCWRRTNLSTAEVSYSLEKCLQPGFDNEIVSVAKVLKDFKAKH